MTGLLSRESPAILPPWILENKVQKITMLSRIFTNIFGSRNQRVLRRLWKTVEKINALEASINALSDEQLRAKTVEFRGRLQKKETLDMLLPEAFAVVREAAKR